MVSFKKEGTIIIDKHPLHLTMAISALTNPELYRDTLCDQILTAFWLKQHF